MRRCLLALVAIALCAADASADKLKVPSQYPTIRSALIPAMPGDIIVIDEGVYHESDLYLELKHDVTVKGIGKVVIDAGGITTGLWINACADLTVKNLRFLNAGIEGIDIQNSEHVSIEGCVIIGPGAEGIRVTSSSAIRIVDCTIRETGAHAVHLAASDSVVSGNVITDLSGVAGVHVDAIQVVVTGNKFIDIHDSAVEVVVPSEPSRVVISDNTIKRAVFGIRVDNDVVGVTVTGNRIEQPSSYGIYVDGGAHSVTNNQVLEATDRGIYVRADVSSVARNVVLEPAVDGFYIAGSMNTIAENVVKKAGTRGFVISAAAEQNFLCDNVAKKSAAYDLTDYSPVGANTFVANTFVVVSP